MTVAIPDVLDFIVLAIAVYGMYKGIEISHPIYALLFTNLTFALFATAINLFVLLAFPFHIWTRFSLYGNLFSLHFHVTSWSIISVLRYHYIEHKDWIERKWPDPKDLTSTALAAQFSCFGAIIFIDIGLLVVFATPHGWPSKGLIQHMPQNVKLLIISGWTILLALPVVVTGIFYVLLVWSRSSSSTSKKKLSNEAEVNRSTLNQRSLSLECYDELQEGQIDSVFELGQSGVEDDELSDRLQNKLAVTSFEYNVILKQSGQHCEETKKKIVNQRREVFVCHGYFGVKDIGESSLTNNISFGNPLDDNEMCERETKKTTSGQQEPILIHVREGDPELKISARQLTGQFNLHSRNETSNISENFAFDDIMVDPTFQGSNNSTTENELNNPTKNNIRSNKSEANSTILNENLVVKRQEAEQMSALRSLKTNLIMILLVGLSMMFLLIPSKTWQAYFCIVDTSFQKGFLPVVTTMANFGTVRTVATQLWKTVVETKLFSLFCKY